MCVTNETVYTSCQHIHRIIDPCFKVRHPSIPFTTCKPSCRSRNIPSICFNCLVIFEAGGFSERKAIEQIAEWRRRENYTGVMTPMRGMGGVRMMGEQSGRLGQPGFIDAPCGAWVNGGEDAASREAIARRLDGIDFLLLHEDV